jgi:hypothetical protein
MRATRVAAAAMVAGLASAVSFAPNFIAASASPCVQPSRIISILPPTLLHPLPPPPPPLIATRISLSPGSVTANAVAGCAVTLTANPIDWKGTALPVGRVTFAILDGPNAGAPLTGSKNANGTSWSVQLSSNKPGTDVVQATFTDGLEIHKSNRAFVQWQTGPPARPIDSPARIQVTPDCFQPAVAESRASDTLKGVKAKAVSQAAQTSTITVTGTDFNPFTAVLITFDAGPGGKPQNFTAQTDGFGVFSQSIQVTEPTEGVHIVRADDFREREAQATYRLPCWQGDIALNPPIGPPGFVTLVVGRNFPPNSSIQFLNWTAPDIKSPFPKGAISTDATGGFQFRVMILYHDELGPRTLQAAVQDSVPGEGNALIVADAPYLVTLGRSQPGDFVERR